ncbi:MAG TPA: hypothetical protein VMW91_02100 [Desulfosporosinus sp.]|nr:hypothetical protein [Desulfosporosinus sp.]
MFKTTTPTCAYCGKQFKEMYDPRDFEEGMCNQDIERFREQEGLPQNGIYDEDDERTGQ